MMMMMMMMMLLFHPATVPASSAKKWKVPPVTCQSQLDSRSTPATMPLQHYWLCQQHPGMAEWPRWAAGPLGPQRQRRMRKRATA